MRKFLLALLAVGLVIIFSSASFAYDEEEARDALITYSGTEAFANLLPEERRACMLWVSEGGYMSELCRNAVTRLISEDPNAVSLSQRKALLAAASGRIKSSSSKTPPTVIKESDNTGPILAAGVIGVIAGMVIHNNLPRDRCRETVYYRAPSCNYRAPRCRPAPPHRVPPSPRHCPRPVMRRNPCPGRR